VDLQNESRKSKRILGHQAVHDLDSEALQTAATRQALRLAAPHERWSNI
jgi:hypothetical protein